MTLKRLLTSVGAAILAAALAVPAHATDVETHDMLGALPAALTAMTGVLLAGAWMLSHRRTRGAHAA